MIGAHICRSLCAAQFAVCTTWNSHAERVPAGRLLAVPLDLADRRGVMAMLRDARPDAVVHCAAMSDLNACERDPATAEAINVRATETIAAWCRESGAVMVFTSTDQVFDGEHAPYDETAAAQPMHVYGRTKREAEQAVDDLGARGLSLRISLVYGRSPTGTRSASEQIERALQRGERPRLFVDEWRTPVLADDIAAAVAEIAKRMLRGEAIVDESSPRVLHFGGPDRVTRYEFGVQLAQRFGMNEGALIPGKRSDLTGGAPRPRDVSLNSDLARRVLRTPLRGVQAGLDQFASSAPVA